MSNHSAAATMHELAFIAAGMEVRVIARPSADPREVLLKVGGVIKGVALLDY